MNPDRLKSCVDSYRVFSPTHASIHITRKRFTSWGGLVPSLPDLFNAQIGETGNEAKLGYRALFLLNLCTSHTRTFSKLVGF